jgi:hypothetical protein
MLNQIKETIRDKYLDFGFTNEQRKAVLIVFGAFIALAFLFFTLAQEALLALTKIDPIDIYKVSHHGSSFQFLPLMSALHPKIALISVGAENSYGHPAPSTVNALEVLGAKTLRTDQDGAISVDEALKIRTKRNDWWNISWG